ncbi:MAG: hypothetical protein ABJZ55_11725 [Fuerstiella sp.]
MKPILTVCFVLFMMISPIQAQHQDAPNTSTSSHSAPPTWTTENVINFRLNQHNNMVVKVLLNEVDECEFMFHTAVDSVSVVSTSTANLKSVQFTHEANTISWGGNQKSRLSIANKIQIGSQTWSDVSITEDHFSGIGTDGKFGWGLFEGKVVEIDFDRQQLRLHSKQPDVTGYDRFETKYQRGGMTLACQIGIGDDVVSHHFLMHSGFSGTALFDDDFTMKHHLHRQWQASAGRELKDSLGNVINTTKVNVPSLTLGSVTLRDLSAELFPGDIGSQKQSVLGGEILKRFNMIVDTQQGQVFLKPNRNNHAE